MRAKLLPGSLIVLAILLAPLGIFAQARSYHYASISDDITVERNASIQVAEMQTYDFSGVYHEGFRSIPHRLLSAITDISVRDADTGREFQYSSHSLDKNDPASWGKYTVYEQDGATNIEWYFDSANATSTYERSFVVSYTAHGAVSFYSDHDELYWNLFTNYSVSVDKAEATIHIAAPIQNPQLAIYTTTTHPSTQDRPDDHTYHFTVSNIAPYEAVTFAAGWQK